METDSIAKLIDGFKTFRDDYYGNDSARSRDYAKLITEGQSPRILMIACSDSRVSPEITFSVSPGDIFMVRNVANIVPPYDADGHSHGTSAAIEFAVNYLNVGHIVIKGHANCGGIASLMKEESDGEFISPWVSIVKKAKDKVLGETGRLTEEEMRSACEKESIILSLENLLSFPFIKTKIEEGKLNLHGWYFDMRKGELLGYEQDGGRFSKLAG